MVKFKPKKAIDWIVWFVGLLVLLGVAGLFIGGSFNANVLFGWIPAVVLQVLGWLIVFAVVVMIVRKFFKK